VDLPENGETLPLETGIAQLLPVSPGKLPGNAFPPARRGKTSVLVHLAACSRTGSYTPDLILEERTLSLEPGRNCIELDWNTIFTDSQYAFVIFRKNPAVSVYLSDTRLSGVLIAFPGREQSSFQYRRTNTA
jgi:hypothetical protein